MHLFCAFLWLTVSLPFSFFSSLSVPFFVGFMFVQICDDVGAYLMADMAHISGLVAAKVGQLLNYKFREQLDFINFITTQSYKN